MEMRIHKQSLVGRMQPNKCSMHFAVIYQDPAHWIMLSRACQAEQAFCSWMNGCASVHMQVHVCPVARVQAAPGALLLRALQVQTRARAATRAVLQAVTQGSSERLMPGLIFNRKKAITYKDPLRGTTTQHMRAGRMECTMQNIADFMTDRCGSSPTPCSAHPPPFLLRGASPASGMACGRLGPSCGAAATWPGTTAAMAPRQPWHHGSHGTHGSQAPRQPWHPWQPGITAAMAARHHGSHGTAMARHHGSHVGHLGHLGRPMARARLCVYARVHVCPRHGG